MQFILCQTFFGGEGDGGAGVTVFTFSATCLATMQQNCVKSFRKIVDIVSFFSLQSFPLLKSHPRIDSILIENDASC